MSGITTDGSLPRVLAPVLTPFDEGLAPDRARFLGLCRILLAQGLGLAPFGTTGEGNSLSVDERIDLLEAMASAGIDMGRVLPGTGCCALPDSVRLSAAAARLGCAGALMLPPFYYKEVSEDGVFRAFAETIERVGDPRLRVYFYHFPRQSQVPVPLAVIERLLARYPGTVAGIKDSSGDLANMEAMCRAFPGFAVFSGSEMLLLPLMRAGGAGCISSNANVNGPALLQLAEGWHGADAEAMQERASAFRRAIHPYPPVAALKALMARRTNDMGWRNLRPPLVPLSADHEEALALAVGDACTSFF